MERRQRLTATALGLILAGCAAPSGDVNFYRAEDLPRVHSPATQVEDLKDGNQSQAKSGTVVITRTEEATPPPTAEDIAAEVRKAAQEAVEREKLKAEAELNAKFKTLAGQTDKLLSHTTEVLKANTSTHQTVNLQIAQQQDAIAEARRQALAQQAERERLKQETEKKLAQVRTEVSNSIAGLALAQNHILDATRQSREQLRAETSRQLSSTLATALDASRRAEYRTRMQNAYQLARVSSTLAGVVARQGASLQPEQVETIAQQAVQQSAPQFRAIALQSVKESQDYIRTVARSAIQADDPAITGALAKAAENVITGDERIVFAIRKVVADEVKNNPEIAKTWVATSAGNVDTANLGIAPLQGVETPQLSETELANVSPAAGTSPRLTTSRSRADWIDIRNYRVVVHEDGRTLEELMEAVLKRSEPFAGPWRIKWKLSDENKDILAEKFSIDVETTFEDFVSYLAQYLMNDRGIKVTFSLFDSERIIVVSD